MELLDALNWRYATKKMNGETVPQEKVERILEAIRLAPSSYGLQPYHVIVVTDPELKKQILPAAYNQTQITDGSHLLVFAAWDDITQEHIDAYVQLIADTRKVTVESLADFKGVMQGLLKLTKEEKQAWTAKQAYLAFGVGIAQAAAEHVDATPMEGFDHAKMEELLGLAKMGLKTTTILPLGHRDAEKDWLAPLPKVRRSAEEFFTRK